MSEDARIAESVQRHGWHAIAVEGTDDEPPFLYTIGLCDRLGHPEIVVLGLEPRAAHALVSDMVAAIRAGRRYEPGEKYFDLIQGHAVELVPVHRTQLICRLGYALGYYRIQHKPDLLRAVQLLWPDEGGHLPNDPRCDRRVACLQPRLDVGVPASELREFMAKYGSPTN